MTPEEKEQRLKEASNKYLFDNFAVKNRTTDWCQEAFMEGAKWQEKQYHSEPPMDLGELKEAYVKTFNEHLGNAEIDFFAPHLKPGKSEWIDPKITEPLVHGYYDIWINDRGRFCDVEYEGDGIYYDNENDKTYEKVDWYMDWKTPPKK